MLEVSALGKRFGSRWVFRGLNFSLKKGDRLAILGPNGSGKTTLLRTIAGLTSPSEGEVLPRPRGRWREASVGALPATSELGMSSLDLALYPALTCAEHLELASDLRGCAPRTEELLNKVGLRDASDQQASELSTGMKARLKLAIAIQAEPAVLLLDEPGAALDESGQKLVDEICDEQARRGVLLIATNDPQERRLANHELVLN